MSTAQLVVAVQSMAGIDHSNCNWQSYAIIFVMLLIQQTAEIEMVTPAVSIPISKDEHGTIRVANTRVTLDSVLARFQQGRTPEQIHESFPTLKLADIYAVITYYLNNQAEVDTYLHQQDEDAGRLRQEIEANQPQNGELRARLLAHMENSHRD